MERDIQRDGAISELSPGFKKLKTSWQSSQILLRPGLSDASCCPDLRCRNRQAKVVQLRRILKSCLRDFAQLMLQVLAGGPKCRHHTCMNSSVCLLKHVIKSFEATYAVLYLYNAVCTSCFVILQTIICEIFVAPVSIFVLCWILCKCQNHLFGLLGHGVLSRVWPRRGRLHQVHVGPTEQLSNRTCERGLYHTSSTKASRRQKFPKIRTYSLEKLVKAMF